MIYADELLTRSRDFEITIPIETIAVIAQAALLAGFIIYNCGVMKGKTFVA